MLFLPPRCQNENTCSGITRIRSEFNGIYRYVAKAQETLTKSVANITHEEEHTYFKTCHNSFNCYADALTENVSLPGYPDDFNRTDPPYNYTDRAQAERYCRSEPSCGGLTAMLQEDSKTIHWEARRGTEFISYSDANLLGSIVKTCPSATKHCLSEPSWHMTLSGDVLFPVKGKWPYDGKSFEKASEYCGLNPQCGGVTKLSKTKLYYAMSRNKFVQKNGDSGDLAWRKVC